MNNSSDLNQEKSLFSENTHHWAEATLPLAYAMACVEVVSKQSEKGKVIYEKIVKMWGKQGINSISDEILSFVPESEQEKIKQALIHPETVLLPDPNKPFKDLEAILTDTSLLEENTKQESRIEELPEEDQNQILEFAQMIYLVFEFIGVGFNRDSDIKKEKFHVSGNAPWLSFAVLLHSMLDYYDITLQKLGNYYMVRKDKNKIIDYRKIMAEQPTSRKHREIVNACKAISMKLKNDKRFTDAAQRWYQSRVVYSSVNKYCDANSNSEIEIDPKNVEKEIKPCDKALGYIGRIRKK